MPHGRMAEKDIAVAKPMVYEPTKTRQRSLELFEIVLKFQIDIRGAGDPC